MAGERLIEFIEGQHTPKSERGDILFGTVISVKPLKVQLSNQMVITEDFIILGKHIGKVKLQGKAVFKKGTMKMTFHSHNDTAQVKETKLEFPEPKHESKDKQFYIEFDNSLEKNDKVTLFRMEGGQQFYLFERTCKKDYGF